MLGTSFNSEMRLWKEVFSRRVLWMLCFLFTFTWMNNFQDIQHRNCNTLTVDEGKQHATVLNSNGTQEVSKEFEDKYFKRVLNQFKFKNLNQVSKKSFRNGKIPKFFLFSKDGLKSDFWKFQLRHISSNECPLPCTFTDDQREISDVDAVVFYLRHVKNRKHVQSILPKRDFKQPWIMLTFEAPLLANSMYRTNYALFNNIFNRTMMYRKDSDIIVNHGFIVSKRDAHVLPFHWRISSGITEPVFYNPNNSLIAALISNCKDKNNRGGYIKNLQNFISVDVYGGCGKFKCGRSMYVDHGYNATTDPCLKKIGTSYMFYLAFENSFCTDYGTEKIYNLLHYPTVPIVLGGINYKEILPPNSYINAADYSPSQLADYVKYLAKNASEYNKYLEWRKYYIPSTISGERIMCDLCTKLYDTKFYEHNVIDDFYGWFLLDSRCERKWTTNNIFNLSYKPIL